MGVPGEIIILTLFLSGVVTADSIDFILPYLLGGASVLSFKNPKEKETSAKLVF